MSLSKKKKNRIYVNIPINWPIMIFEGYYNRGIIKYLTKVQNKFQN